MRKRTLLFWAIGAGLPSWLVIFKLADHFLWHHAKFHLLLSIPILTFLVFFRYSPEMTDTPMVPLENKDLAKKWQSPLPPYESSPHRPFKHLTEVSGKWFGLTMNRAYLTRHSVCCTVVRNSTHGKWQHGFTNPQRRVIGNRRVSDRGGGNSMFFWKELKREKTVTPPSYPHF
jgi:hypothetical protein